MRYCRCWDGDPEDRLNAFLLVDQESTYLPIPSEDPLYIEKLDTNEDLVLDFRELWAFVEGYEWDEFPSDSTRVTVPIVVRVANADFNHSGLVDFQDFTQFADRFGAARDEVIYAEQFDLNGDGLIDYADFFIFADRFGLAR